VRARQELSPLPVFLRQIACVAGQRFALSPFFQFAWILVFPSAAELSSAGSCLAKRRMLKGFSVFSVSALVSVRFRALCLGVPVSAQGFTAAVLHSVPWR
jgi:hypothetical protein